MSIRAMFVGNAPARAAAPAVKPTAGPLAGSPRAEQDLARAMLGDELPAQPPTAEKPAAPTQPARD